MYSQNFNLIYHKFVLIFKFKYNLQIMQPRLQRSKGNVSFTKIVVKILLALLVIFFLFFFVEKINFPSPKNEINEDVTDKIIKLR